jgi:hypothetical protein
MMVQMHIFLSFRIGWMLNLIVGMWLYVIIPRYIILHSVSSQSDWNTDFKWYIL